MIIRNPTHFAVALKFTEKPPGAYLTVKGKDAQVIRIIEIYKENSRIVKF